jgi:hypothetical protein
MFNPYGRRSPIFQRTPYFKNFPGAEFAGMQLTNFKINPAEQVERKGLLKFLGPKTRQTWSGEWTRNPQTGAVTPAATTTRAAAVTTPATRTIPKSTQEPPSAFGINPGMRQFTPEEKLAIETPYQDPKDYKMMMEEYERNKQRNQEFLNNPFGSTPQPFSASSTVGFTESNVPGMKYGGYKYQPGGGVVMNEVEVTGPGQGLQRMPMLSPNYGDLMAATPGLANPTIDTRYLMSNEPIKNALTVDIPALYKEGMYYTKDITNTLEDIRKENDYYANLLAQTTGRNEQFGNRGNYTINQLSNSSNFRPDLDGQIQYSQYGGPVVGEELEMTDEEIKKFLKGGGKLRYV